MVSINKVLMGVISIIIATILIALVLIPTIQGIEFTGSNATMYTTLIGVVGTIAIVIPVMMAAKMITGGRD